MAALRARPTRLGLGRARFRTPEEAQRAAPRGGGGAVGRAPTESELRSARIKDLQSRLTALALSVPAASAELDAKRMNLVQLIEAADQARRQAMAGRVGIKASLAARRATEKSEGAPKLTGVLADLAPLVEAESELEDIIHRARSELANLNIRPGKVAIGRVERKKVENAAAVTAPQVPQKAEVISAAPAQLLKLQPLEVKRETTFEEWKGFLKQVYDSQTIPLNNKIRLFEDYLLRARQRQAGVYTELKGLRAGGSARINELEDLLVNWAMIVVWTSPKIKVLKYQQRSVA